jgi:hypothetical protein
MNTVIAVLSTIILAATVLTLCLGIFAYIIYKIRRRGKVKKVSAEPSPSFQSQEGRGEPVPTQVVTQSVQPLPEATAQGVQQPEKVEVAATKAKTPDLEKTPSKAVEKEVVEPPSLIRRYEPEKKKERRAEWK